MCRHITLLFWDVPVKLGQMCECAILRCRWWFSRPFRRWSSWPSLPLCTVQPWAAALNMRPSTLAGRTTERAPKTCRWREVILCFDHRSRMVTLVLVLLVLLVVLVVPVVLGVVVEAAWFGSSATYHFDLWSKWQWYSALFIMEILRLNLSCHDAIPFKIFKTFQYHDGWLVVSGGWSAQYFVDVAFW